MKNEQLLSSILDEIKESNKELRKEVKEDIAIIRKEQGIIKAELTKYKGFIGGVVFMISSAWVVVMAVWTKFN